MDKKKILIVSRSFYPGNWPRAFRATELAKEFARQGHEVNVITHRKELHDNFEKEYNLTILDLGTPKWKGLGQNGNKAFCLIKKIISRLMSYFFEYPNIELVKMVSNVLKNEAGYDLLISIAHPYPIHWGVAKARSKKPGLAKIWVADCGDPYMKTDNATYSPPFYFTLVDKWFMKKTDYITIPIEEAIEGYNCKFHNKFRIIPQGFRFEDIKVFRGNPPGNSVVFGYAGMFIPGKRDPSEFLNFLNSLEYSYKFEFHIYTHSPHLIEPYLLKSNGRIILQPVMSRENVLFELSKMNFVVNFENQGNKQSPSKLIDYGILEKPVLSVKYGDLKKEIILQFLKGDYSNRMMLPDIEQYRIENVTKSFLSLLK